MVVANRTSEEERVLDASNTILQIIGDDYDRDFDPTYLVAEAARTHDRYSARAAVLHLLEIGKLRLSADWRVRAVRSPA
jgi:hypothetical protein